MIKIIVSFIVNTVGLLASLYKMSIRPNRSQNFYGYWFKSFAIRYARKRYEWWPNKYDQLGKHQRVFEISGDDKTLVVLSPLELKLFKKHKIIGNDKWFRKLFKKESIWTTLKYNTNHSKNNI